MKDRMLKYGVERTDGEFRHLDTIKKGKLGRRCWSKSKTAVVWGFFSLCCFLWLWFVREQRPTEDKPGLAERCAFVRCVCTVVLVVSRVPTTGPCRVSSHPISSGVQLKNDNVRGFDTTWNEQFSLRDIPDEEIYCKSFFKRQLQYPEDLLQICREERKGQPFQCPQRRPVSSRSSSTQRKPKKISSWQWKGDCAQLTSKGQCSRGDSCRFKHDGDQKRKGNEEDSLSTSTETRGHPKGGGQDPKVPVRQESQTSRRATSPRRGEA